MKTEQLRQVLEQLHFTAEMNDASLQRLAEVSAVREYPADTVLFREGSSSDELFLISEGRVSLAMNIPGRGKLAILTLGPGDVLGWSAVIGQGEMTASAVTMEETQAVVASGPKLLELCQQDHEFGYHLMQRMAAALSRRLVATRLQLLDLFSQQTPVIDPTLAEGGGTA